MISNFFNTRLELNQKEWFKELGKSSRYSLFSLTIGESVGQLTIKLGNSSRIVKNFKETYHVHYYSASENSTVGFQVIDTRIAGFSIVNNGLVSKNFIYQQLGEPSEKTPVIGQVFSFMDYEIEAYLYYFNAHDIIVKLDEEENEILTFYFGPHWTNLSIESFPSEIL